MRKIREVLRLRLEADLCSPNQYLYQGQCRLHPETPQSAQALGLYLARLPTELDDGRLAALLFYPQADTTISARHVVPDWPSVHQGAVLKGVSKQLRLGGVHPALSQ